MSDNKIPTIAKLRGASNYEIWKICITAYITREGAHTAILSDTIDNNNNKALSTINLLIEDSLLL